MKRLLDLVASDVNGAFKRKELVRSISAAAGRAICTEVIAPAAPILGDTSNAELASCLGGDLLLPNIYDLNAPVIRGMPREDAPEQTIRQFGLQAKMLGADIQHIGDSGWYGVAVPENILALSIAIRGRRHAYRRMARQAGR